MFESSEFVASVTMKVYILLLVYCIRTALSLNACREQRLVATNTLQIEFVLRMSLNVIPRKADRVWIHSETIKKRIEKHYPQIVNMPVGNITAEVSQHGHAWFSRNISAISESIQTISHYRTLSNFQRGLQELSELQYNHAYRPILKRLQQFYVPSLLCQIAKVIHLSGETIPEFVGNDSNPLPVYNRLETFGYTYHFLTLLQWFVLTLHDQYTLVSVGDLLH